jgi:hypothetical protein
MKARKIIRRSEAIYYKHINWLFKIRGNSKTFIGLKHYQQIYPKWDTTSWDLQMIESGLKLTEEQARNQCPECFI